MQRKGKRGPIPLPLDKRFWSKVNTGNPEDCWNWTGQTNGNGYGVIRVGSSVDGTRRMSLAHRVSYQLSRGEISEGMDVCHSCDNRLCCNPKHFFIGTHADNDLDRDRKGRGTRPPYHSGETHPRAKLTLADVETIRQRIENGESQSSIARHFEVGHTTIGRIARGERWINQSETASRN